MPLAIRVTVRHNRGDEVRAMEIDQVTRANVRARALRAARVVTLGLAMASAPGCGQSHEGELDSGPGADGGEIAADTGMPGDDGGPDDADSGITLADSGPGDGGGVVADAAPADGGAVADAAPDDGGAVADAGDPLACPPIWPPSTKPCCEAEPGGFWDEASMMCWVAVPGPFVPPTERVARV